MTGTIQFSNIDRSGPAEKLPLQLVRIEGKGTELTFNRGVDTRSRRPYRYTVLLTPAIKAGSWQHHEDSGLIEHVAQKVEGTTIVYTGIWAEGGQRLEMRVEIMPDLAQDPPSA